MRASAEFLDRVRLGATFSAKEMVCQVSRLRWSVQCIDLLAPFMQPLHALAATAAKAGRPITAGAVHRQVSTFMQTLLHEHHYKYFAFGMRLPGMAASDASASKEGRAGVGGWIDFVTPPSKQRAMWFSVELDKAVHEWAWAKQGEPHRVISTLEMLGVLLLIRLLSSVGLRGRHCVVNFAGIIDNLGDAFAFLKQYSKKAPQAYMHMEMSHLCAREGITPQLSHTPCEHNAWADELSKGELAGWNPERRWHPDMSPSAFCIFFKLINGDYNS